MNYREIIINILEGKKPHYVPWHLNFTVEAREKLLDYYKVKDIETRLNNHFLELVNREQYFREIEKDFFMDHFGVIWDRTIDKDIGIVNKIILKEPNLTHYNFPDPLADFFFKDIPNKIKKIPDKFRVFYIDYSLYERAWSLRGMENLLADMIINPEFVKSLLGNIADYNITQIKKALSFDIDAVYFGDDWGMQTGLQMGYKLWKKFVYPEIKRMYKVVKSEERFVYIHCCGGVDELFDDLIDIGLDIFNPFQPEVMNIYKLLEKYRGKLTFHGGMSTQKVLPYYSNIGVKEETRRLLNAGIKGSYIFAPAHAVEGDVPIENLIAFIEELHNQERFFK